MSREKSTRNPYLPAPADQLQIPEIQQPNAELLSRKSQIIAIHAHELLMHCFATVAGATSESMKIIITALDFSDASPAVLTAAVQMAKVQNAILHIIHVLEPEPTYTAYGMTPEEFPAIQVFQEESQKRAEAKINEALATAKQSLSENDIRAELLIGSPLQAIVDYAMKTEADLIVIGSHGHGIVAALLIGSVAEGLVRKAACATLIIPCS
jgi:nucleotide-binding universal stress UspA family protein